MDFNNNHKFKVNAFQSQQQQVIKCNYHIYNLITLTQNKFASVGDSNKISIWKIRNAKLVNQFCHNSCSSLWALEKIDYNLIAVGGDGDYNIKIFNWHNGLHIQTYQGHYDYICTIKKLYNINQIVSAGSDCSIIVWKQNNGQLIKNIQFAHNNIIFNCICFNEKYVISAGCENKLKIWSSEDDWCLINEIMVNGGSKTKAILKINENQIATAQQDGFIRIFEIPSLECTSQIQIHSKNCVIYKLCNLEADTIILTCFNNNNAKIVNWKQKLCLEEKTMKCNSIYCGLTVIGKNIITGSKCENEIIVWC